MDTYRLKERGWKNIFHINGNQKKAGIAILISGKIIKRYKKDHLIMIRSQLIKRHNYPKHLHHQ